MSYVYFVSPVGSDPNYEAKRRILAGLENETGVRFFLPVEHRSPFSLQATKSDVENALVVIADLSLERPSCYFELGIAQALGATVVLIASAGTTLHQAGNECAVHMYADLEEYRCVVVDAVTSYCSPGKMPLLMEQSMAPRVSLDPDGVKHRIGNRN